MKIIGNAQFAAEPIGRLAGAERPGRARAVHPRLPPARGTRRRRLRDDGRRRGRLHQGRVRRTGATHRPGAAGSFRMHAQGAGAAGTIGADVLVTLEGVVSRRHVGHLRRGRHRRRDDRRGGAADAGRGVEADGGRVLRQRGDVLTAGLLTADSAAPARRGRGVETIRRFAPPAGPVHRRRDPVGPVRCVRSLVTAGGCVFTAPKGNVVTAVAGRSRGGSSSGAAAALVGALVGRLDLGGGRVS